MQRLTQDDLIAAVTRIGELADAECRPVELLMVGGGVMVLEFDARNSTRDVDAVVIAAGDAARVRRYAAVVASERGWAADWSNDGAKGFLSGPITTTLLFAARGVRLSRPSVEQLLAMKLSAWRDDLDMADAARLLATTVGDRASVVGGPSVRATRPGGDGRICIRLLVGGTPMTALDRIARAALDGDALAARAYPLEWMDTRPRVSDVPAPDGRLDETARALAAALTEMFAARWGQVPPDWAAGIEPAPSPTHLVRATERMPWFRAQFEAEAPMPLRRRRLFAPANYLELV